MSRRVSAISGVRILEKDSNKRGDLFGRLVGHLFLALGYDDVRLNVHKAGREVDVEALHRTEPRRVVAECKATKKKTGGDAINKFVGTLDAERRRTPDVETVGYFISLSGFKETAIEQEKDAGGDRVVLLDGERVIEELINGRIIVSPKQAMEQAGRCAARVTAELAAEPTCELVAHEMGWVWVVGYTSKKQRTHFALIHADGEPIAPAPAESIIASDKSVAGRLHSLSYLAPAVQASQLKSQIDTARTRYFEYLASECGGITLEGLPADQDIGQRRLKLESIFVPLYLEELGPRERGPSVSAPEGQLGSNQTVRADGPSDTEARSAPRIFDDYVPSAEKARRPVGEVLSEHTRLAILGAPGGGKTTLLKRLAVSYAFPDRSGLVDDRLPDRTWLPLFIRCRQLGELAKSPIGDILRAIPERSEMAELCEPFAELVHTSLRRGDALLLVDGLDEIADEGARVCFVTQLRTFLATYPNASVVVTSREAGFRIVGGALSAHCRHYKLADFDEDDVERLTVAWFKEVGGDSAEVQSEAEKLAELICDTDRVRALATNPLLLTTLLLVKRWLGHLPTRRSVLYGKAMEVLLMTWNVEGYEPIDQEEAIPQLAFVAFAMMRDGVQTISSRRLKELLHLARQQMPEVLG
ncbi:MAG: NACHT domain-containing protein, partial [Anaerolineae bacterium]